MCGIAGFIDHRSTLGDADLKAMQSALKHRGPDDYGALISQSPGAQIGLAHTRLSILDLSAAGHQPMRFGQLSIVYNGEIYNFREIREDLERIGHAFYTECDTEVILHAFAEWGPACLDRFIGMFAFALHDASRRLLFLVRDRVGVKPLYVHRGPSFLLFASELKAFHACSAFEARLDQRAVRDYFRHGYVPDDDCIFENSFKVDAGCYLVCDTDSLEHRVVRWWDQTSLYHQDRHDFEFEDAVDQLEELIQSACEYRMVADVPIGVFLSGGYDSTAVAATLQNHSSQPIKTFTIGFTEGNDEAPAARAIASELGTDHHELYCSPKEALELIPALPDIYDEPFADSSGIPTVLVSRMARNEVKVALSADGGDELFGGYTSYPATARRMRYLQSAPAFLRRGMGRPLESISRILPDVSHRLQHQMDSLARSLHPDDRIMAQRLHTNARLMPARMIDRLLAQTNSGTSEIEDRNWPSGTHTMDACMGIDYQSYLKDDILTKVDRATMSVGLEGREPLLDHRLAEFSARLPMKYKYDGKEGKRILKAVVHRHVPKSLMDRPKTGFRLPIMKWLREDLDELFSQVCSFAGSSDDSPIDSKIAAQWVNEFRRGCFHYQPLIWRLFVFQLWRARWL